MKLIACIYICLLTISTFAQDTLSFDSIEYRVKGLGNNPARYFYNNKPFSGIVVKGYRQNPQEIIAVENGKTHGWYKSFHNNGQPKVLEHYEFGRRDGSSQRWYESGQLQYQMTYEQGHLKDTVWGWHENGQLKKMSIEQPFKKYTVESNLWYENGQLQYRATENFQESYHENGKLRVKGTLVKHKCHGKFKYFDENGKVEKIIHWQHGKKKKVITK